VAIAANEHTDHELIVAADGSIPADQLERLGVRPGAHLRVVQSASPTPAAGSISGSLSHLPDVSWNDFQRASELARCDLSAG